MAIGNTQDREQDNSFSPFLKLIVYGLVGRQQAFLDAPHHRRTTQSSIMTFVPSVIISDLQNHTIELMNSLPSLLANNMHSLPHKLSTVTSQLASQWSEMRQTPVSLQEMASFIVWSGALRWVTGALVFGLAVYLTFHPLLKATLRWV